MKCEACGARNSSDATWCTQCYASFVPEAAASPEPSPEQPAAPGAAPVTSLPQEGVQLRPAAPNVGGDATNAEGTDTTHEIAASGIDPPSPPTANNPVEVGDVREIDGVVQWRCRSCQGWVALEQTHCSTCGAVRVGFGEAESSEVDVGDLDERTILGATLALPGLGHVLAGRTGSGTTRIVLWAMWLLGGLWWSFSTSAGRTPGLLLLLGAAVLWAATLWDVRSLLNGATDEPFGVRGLLWLVVGVTGLLMLTVALVATGPVSG